MVVINRLEDAVQYVRQFIKDGRWESRFPTGQNATYVEGIKGSKGDIAKVLIAWEIWRNPQKLYVFFKRDVFRTFAHMYNLGDRVGPGQTINLLALRRAVNDQALVVIVSPDGFIQFCNASDFMQYVNEHNTIRQPSTESEGSFEASAPVSILKNV